MGETAGNNSQAHREREERKLLSETQAVVSEEECNVYLIRQPSSAEELGQKEERKLHLSFFPLLAFISSPLFHAQFTIPLNQHWEQQQWREFVLRHRKPNE